MLVIFGGVTYLFNINLIMQQQSTFKTHNTLHQTLDYDIQFLEKHKNHNLS